MLQSTQSRKARFLSADVLLNGVQFGLSLVTVENGKVTVEPFEGETYSTVYCNKIIITTNDDNSIRSFKTI